MRPRVIEDPQLNEQAERVRSDPFPDDVVALEVHDGDRPFLNRSSSSSEREGKRQDQAGSVPRSSQRLPAGS
jgi:hypothetical protein